VAACAAKGTATLTCAGENLAWMRTDDRTLIAATAEKSGRRVIVFSVAFGLYPFDLGVVFLNRKPETTGGGPIARIKGRCPQDEKVTFSGGTCCQPQAGP